MLQIARVVAVLVVLGLASVAHATAPTGDHYVGCFEAVEIDTMQYVDASLAKKILARQRNWQRDKLQVTLKLNRNPDGTVTDVEFVKRSDLPELDDASRKIALSSNILCPTQPDMSQVLDNFQWSMHLSANESTRRIEGIALADRGISNVRSNFPAMPSSGQACDVIRDANGVATMANCNLDGFCKPTKLVTPDYPDSELANGIYGMTLVEAMVTEDGKPTAMKVIRSSGSSKLDYAAIRSWDGTRFECKGSNPNRRVRMFFDFGKPTQPQQRRR